MQQDPNRPEDALKVNENEDRVGGDDGADAVQYMVATKSRTIAQWKLRVSESGSKSWRIEGGALAG